MPIDLDILRRAVPTIRTTQEAAHRMRRDIERYEEAEAFGREDPRDALVESASEDEARAYFEGSLTAYFQSLVIGMEASGLPNAAAALRESWTFDKEALRKTSWDGQYEYTLSEPLSILEASFDALARLGGEPTEERELQKLEQLLASTATIVRRDGVTPTGELDVQSVMHKYLEVYYDAGFTKTPSIQGALQNFVPDCGVANLKTAIEFKFVDSEVEAKTAIRGILEDTAGYRGSLDWTRFYAVIYQTGAWVSEHRYRQEVLRVGADAWKVIAVVGGGARKGGRKTRSPGAPPIDASAVKVE